MSGDREDEDDRLGPAGRDDRGEARLGHRRARVAADQRVRRARRQPEYQVIRSQMIAPTSPPNDDGEGDDVDVDHAGADRLARPRCRR